MLGVYIVHDQSQEIVSYIMQIQSIIVEIFTTQITQLSCLKLKKMKYIAKLGRHIGEDQGQESVSYILRSDQQLYRILQPNWLVSKLKKWNLLKNSKVNWYVVQIWRDLTGVNLGCILCNWVDLEPVLVDFLQFYSYSKIQKVGVATGKSRLSHTFAVRLFCDFFQFFSSPVSTLGLDF